MSQTQNKVRKVCQRGLAGVQSMRAAGVPGRAKRGLTEIQRKVIRHMVNQPGKTLKEYADAASAVIAGCGALRASSRAA